MYKEGYYLEKKTQRHTCRIDKGIQDQTAFKDSEINHDSYGKLHLKKTRTVSQQNRWFNVRGIQQCKTRDSIGPFLALHLSVVVFQQS